MLRTGLQEDGTLTNELLAKLNVVPSDWLGPVPLHPLCMGIPDGCRAAFKGSRERSNDERS